MVMKGHQKGIGMRKGKRGKGMGHRKQKSAPLANDISAQCRNWQRMLHDTPQYQSAALCLLPTVHTKSATVHFLLKIRC